MFIEVYTLNTVSVLQTHHTGKTALHLRVGPIAVVVAVVTRRASG